MQLAIGVVDLTSMEPCDSSFYPLRLCYTEDNEILKLKDQLKLYFYIADKNLQENLEKIRVDSREYEEERVILKHKVTPQMWETYKEYLKLLLAGFNDFLNLDYEKPNNKGVYLKKLTTRVQYLVNSKAKSKKYKLKNMWDHLGLK